MASDQCKKEDICYLTCHSKKVGRNINNDYCANFAGCTQSESIDRAVLCPSPLDLLAYSRSPRSKKFERVLVYLGVGFTEKVNFFDNCAVFRKIEKTEARFMLLQQFYEKSSQESVTSKI